MSSIKPPKPLLVDNDIDMEQEWTEWEEMYNNYFIAAKIGDEKAEVQAANFKSIIGRSAMKVMNSLGLTEIEKGNLATMKSKLRSHFAPAKNKTYERCQFHRIKQQPNESFEDFYQKLTIQVNKCSYGFSADEFVMDQIVLGIFSETTRQKLWVEENLTLEKTKKICRVAERATKQMTELQHEGASMVNMVNKDFNCKRCGNKHGYKSCPAFNKRCSNCKKLGHFETRCTKKNNKENRFNSKQKNKKVNVIDNESSQYDSESDEQNQYTIGTIEIIKQINAINEDDKWSANLMVGNKQLKVKLDTGAECNVLSLKEAKRLQAKIENSTTKRLIAYNNENIKVVGEMKIECKTKKNNKELVVFKIVNEDLQSVLGRQMCEKLGFVVRINQIKKEKEKLSYCKNFEYEIDFIENPKFKIMPARRIAYPIREQVKSELEKMISLGVIEPISEPTPAVSPMVVVQKGTSLRICMDPTELNKNIKRRHYPLKTVEEIAAIVGKSKYFTKLDCKKGFWQIKVSEATSKYLTFATPWGRYRYLRLPFGISSAPEVFCEVMNRTLNGIKNCQIAMDDIFLFSESVSELKNITKKVIDTLHKAGFTLNKDKCEFNKTKVKFLGHIFTQSGYEADSDKIVAIQQLKVPSNVKELQRLLGMVNYLGKFIPNLSNITEPLRVLLHKNTSWFWDCEQQKSFEQIKKALTSTPVLKYYDVNKEVKLSVDASCKAMGACLMQDGQPIAYATRAFTKGQQNFPQIEKEAMAIKFACHKFHEYVYGKKLLIETDHKPLETIFKKSLQNAPLRLQKILWDVLQYSPSVKYIKGTQIPIADTLSRDTVPVETENDEEYRVNLVLSMTAEAEKRFIEATVNDRELQLLLTFVKNGWPDENNKLPETIKKYSNFKEEISYEGGLLFKAHKVIVPAGEIADIIKQVHTGHAGITTTLARARQSLYWYGQTNDIQTFIEKCAVCQQTQKSNPREPMIMKTIPDFPFQHVSTDIFKFKGDDFLLFADHYSGFMDFRKLKSSTSAEVILYFRQWFAVHGIPEILESDGGPQYSSKKFKDFSKNWNFKHIISSPHYPRSNGFAERNVQTAKNILKKCYLDNTDVYLALLMLRNTPRNEILKSPNQRLFSRLTRTIIPMEKELLKPSIVAGVSSELYNLRKKQKVYVDKVASPLEKLNIGDKVRMKVAHREWKGAKVVGETEYPRSVIVQTNEGNVYRRNTHQLHKTKADINIHNQVPLATSSNDDVLQEFTAADQPVQKTLNENIMVESPKPVQKTLNENIMVEAPKVTTEPDIINDFPKGISELPKTTRSGRTIKKPVIFDPSS